MKGNIEYIKGQESHSSNFGKFYVKGLEKWEVKEDFEENRHDKHHQYQGYVCLDVPVDTCFTVFVQEGDKQGTKLIEFYICKISVEQNEHLESDYTGCYALGNFEVVAKGTTKTKAPRLMDWWTNSDKTLQEAEHFAKYIDKRGIKTPPEME